MPRCALSTVLSLSLLLGCSDSPTVNEDAGGDASWDAAGDGAALPDGAARDTGGGALDADTGSLEDTGVVGHDAGPPTGAGRYLFATTVPGRALPYWGTTDLETGDALATRALVVVHGTNRNADDYFDRAVTAAERAEAEAQTVLIAPHFVIEEDSPATDVLYWSTNGGWKRGDQSSPALSPRLSSFEAVDAILLALGDQRLFPRVTEIVVTGHSAGGQFVQRFAMGSVADLSVTHATFRYAPANPSSYAYLDGRRSVGESRSEFGAPDTTCAYDEWKYGLSDLNNYMQTVGAATARARYRGRDVVYMLGEDDDDATDPDLDTSCAAVLQGPHRYARGLIFFGAVQAHYGAQPHQLVTVPGVGHSSSQMFRSDEGIGVLFGR